MGFTNESAAANTAYKITLKNAFNNYDSGVILSLGIGICDFNSLNY